jgi:hypothetical protein
LGHVARPRAKRTLAQQTLAEQTWAGGNDPT